ncbi:DUF4129 domain-containing protein [Halarchaeum sp. CBA1220]|uniref:transglutaminase TgpA family protein n=1 Tax=Halarchaeum sp. CBA1220 TaxID=1853682 RepID=UPI000F3A8179|nr:transglutaminaseTgpA domain-containing protein [Halarchaeum sp. CBA1220]QLC33530.1 DUF4129 domain-containing protein [Halarchaeum sp. CBA1220]
MTRTIPVLGRLTPYRLGALACVAVLSASSLAVLYHVLDVVGGLDYFWPVLAGALLLAAAAQAVRPRVALGVGSLLLAAGFGVYVATAPESYTAALTAARVAEDVLAFLTGYSVFRMVNVTVWALAMVPTPAFLTWYFALRERYAAAVGVAGLALGFFVCTGDSGTVATLVGVLAGAGAVGLGTLDRYGATRQQLEALAVAAALMTVAPAVVTAVPGGSAAPIVPGSDTAPSGSIVSAGERVGVGGAIELSPEVQFVVESDVSTYWRVAVYDRYTGSGWVRTGDGGTLAGPPGASTRITQTVTAKRPLSAMPAAAEPVSASGVDYSVTSGGNPVPTNALAANESYRVVSEHPRTWPDLLANAGTDYPESVTERYLQVPDTTGDRVGALAERVTENASTPYAKARAVESWLEANKSYSLAGAGADGNLVRHFLLDAEQGYCVHFASAMVVLLREEGVPARFATGYTAGQHVGNDTHVVRGLDSHAWVEVYFPDVGWVRFDPTPADPREQAEQARLDDARERNESGVDAAGSEPTTTTTATTDPEPDDGRTTTTTAAANATNGSGAVGATPTLPPGYERPDAGTATASDGGLPSLPEPRVLALWGVLLGGVLVGLRRLGVFSRAYRAVWLRWLPRGDPARTVDGAYARVEYVLGRRRRPRRDGETVREYLRAIDAPDAARRIAALRERARYRGDVTSADAAAARDELRELVGENGRP